MMYNFLSQEAREMGSFAKKGNMGEKEEHAIELHFVSGDSR